MPFAAAISEHPLATHAVGEVVGQVLERLGDEPDVVVAFATAPFAGAFDDIAAAIRATLRPRSFIGATGAGVLANGQEVEAAAAVSVFAARFADPEPAPRTVRIAARQVVDEVEVATDLDLADATGTLLLLADPFSVPVTALLDDLAVRAPQLTVVGGLASAGVGPGGNRLVADERATSQGAVALLLPAGVATSPLVSQGADPVGEPLVVTRSTGTLIEEIAGQPALDRLLALADAVDSESRSRIARGLHLGIVVDERRVEFERDDFLIVPVLGADKGRRAVAVGPEVPVGTTVQFHVRDAASADADLRALLVDAPGRAALAFAGRDRGRSLFPTPHHDAAILHEHVEGGAVAGLFCAGELGPIGSRSRLHDRSLSVVLFER